MCLFRKKPEVFAPEPESSKRITYEELHKLLSKKFPKASVYLSDKDYLLCSYNDVAVFLASDMSDRYEYSEESFDCDDFSYRLMGQFSTPKWSDLCFGIMWTSDHAFNIFVGEDKKIFFVEPQNDEIGIKILGSGEERLIVL